MYLVKFLVINGYEWIPSTSTINVSPDAAIIVEVSDSRKWTGELEGLEEIFPRPMYSLRVILN